jgi:hypothetical protein
VKSSHCRRLRRGGPELEQRHDECSRQGLRQKSTVLSATKQCIEYGRAYVEEVLHILLCVRTLEFAFQTLDLSRQDLGSYQQSQCDICAQCRLLCDALLYRGRCQERVYLLQYTVLYPRRLQGKCQREYANCTVHHFCRRWLWLIVHLRSIRCNVRSRGIVLPSSADRREKLFGVSTDNHMSHVYLTVLFIIASKLCLDVQCSFASLRLSKGRGE